MKIPFRAIAILITALLILGPAATGCGFFKSGVKVLAVAVGALGQDPFFATNFGEDVSNIRPGPNGTLDGEVAGLYGGTLKKRHCNKTTLIKYLTTAANLQKAAAWAKVKGIQVKDIPAYIKRLTPVLLRSDTRVRNHGFKKGLATVFEALLEAGVAVLIDERGQPVVKCNCGNPLYEPLKGETDFKVDIPEKSWKRRYSKKKVTVVKPSRPKRVRRFYLTDIDTGQGIGRPAGSDASKDVKLPPPPAIRTSSKSTEARPGILGTWRATQYASSQVRVAQTGDGAFTGTIAQDLKLTDTCTLQTGRVTWHLKGSGSHYTGTIVAVEANTCGSGKEITATWDLTGQNSFRLCLTSGAQQPCENWQRL